MGSGAWWYTYRSLHGEFHGFLDSSQQQSSQDNLMELRLHQGYQTWTPLASAISFLSPCMFNFDCMWCSEVEWKLGSQFFFIAWFFETWFFYVDQAGLFVLGAGTTTPPAWVSQLCPSAFPGIELGLPGFHGQTFTSRNLCGIPME